MKQPIYEIHITHINWPLTPELFLNIIYPLLAEYKCQDYVLVQLEYTDHTDFIVSLTVPYKVIQVNLDYALDNFKKKYNSYNYWELLTVHKSSSSSPSSLKFIEAVLKYAKKTGIKDIKIHIKFS